MTSAAFDTPKAIADTVRGAMSEGVATRADIAGLEARIAELKVTILPAIFGAAGASFAALEPFPGGAP